MIKCIYIILFILIKNYISDLFRNYPDPMKDEKKVGLVIEKKTLNRKRKNMNQRKQKKRRLPPIYPILNRKRIIKKIFFGFEKKNQTE